MELIPISPGKRPKEITINTNDFGPINKFIDGRGSDYDLTDDDRLYLFINKYTGNDVFVDIRTLNGFYRRMMHTVSVYPGVSTSSGNPTIYLVPHSFDFLRSDFANTSVYSLAYSLVSSVSGNRSATGKMVVMDGKYIEAGSMQALRQSLNIVPITRDATITIETVNKIGVIFDMTDIGGVQEYRTDLIKFSSGNSIDWDGDELNDLTPSDISDDVKFKDWCTSPPGTLFEKESSYTDISLLMSIRPYFSTKVLIHDSLASGHKFFDVNDVDAFMPVNSLGSHVADEHPLYRYVGVYQDPVGSSYTQQEALSHLFDDSVRVIDIDRTRPLNILYESV